MDLISRKPSESLNAFLKRVREWAKISQARWAEAAGVDQGQVSRWESGKGEPGVGHLKGIAQLLGTTIGAVVGDEKLSFAPPRPPTAEELTIEMLRRFGVDKNNLEKIAEILSGHSVDNTDDEKKALKLCAKIGFGPALRILYHRAENRPLPEHKELIESYETELEAKSKQIIALTEKIRKIEGDANKKRNR